MADCRRFESDDQCQLTIIGPEEDVLAAAVQHAVTLHGHEDTPELRDGLARCSRPRAPTCPGTACRSRSPA